MVQCLFHVCVCVCVCVFVYGGVGGGGGCVSVWGVVAKERKPGSACEQTDQWTVNLMHCKLF